MKLKTTGLEVRGIEEKMSKKTGNCYLVVRVEDNNGEWLNFIDRNLSNKEIYTKGTYYDFLLDLYVRKEYTSISIINACPTNKDEH